MKFLRRSRAAKISALVIAAFIVAGGGLIFGLSQRQGLGSKKGNAASTTSTAATGAACPLTGVPTSAGGVPNRPALAVKVDNAPPARPQSGVDSADIVFEEPVEGGLTRLVAVFQCKSPSMIGPIRSARAADVGIIDLLSNPIFMHVGGINPVLQLINSANDHNDDLISDASGILHPSGRHAPYDTYTSAATQWSKYPKDASAPTPVFSYSTSIPTGNPAASAHIPFSSYSDNTWNWNSHTSQWDLSVNGNPATDSATSSPVAVSNVVAMKVQITYGPWQEDANGDLEVQVNFTSGGDVTVLRNGESITGTWTRNSLNLPMQLVGQNGDPILLAPGETWVELVPNAIPVTVNP